MIQSLSFNLVPYAFILLPALGCVAVPTTAPKSGVSLPVACYKYEATHSDNRTVSGHLQITETKGISFAGTLSALEITPTGQAQSISGVVTGQLLDSSNVDFTWSLSGAGFRRHLGPATGAPGQWLDETFSLLGTYTLKRGCS